MPEAGDRIADRYELLARLGEGGMGVVWRAHDEKLNRSVAVKLLGSTSVGSTHARSRLVREARAAAALEHDGIIRVYDVGELPDGGAYLVMEYVRGTTLRRELEKGPLAPARAVRIVADAARALHFAHEAGIVHRDVKPDNIMLRKDDRAIVVDFGIAKPVATEVLATAETLAGLTSTTATAEGQIVGTPAYLSPEQARGEEIGPASDQFSLGVTAFEALTGRRPWTGKGLVEVVASILKDEPAPLRSLAPGATEELERVIARALAKDPGDRFPDMAAFATALDEIAPSLSTATPSATTAPESAMPAPSTHGGQTKTSDDASAKKRPWALVLVVAALGAAALLAVRDRTSGTAAGGPEDVVACPPFEVTGIDAPWLGAAAAALSCERMQIARGGIDARTRHPAELAGLPRDVAPGFPRGVYDTPEARTRGIEAAKAYPRWLDGRVEKHPDAYSVHVAMRKANGDEIARGEGRGVELFEAVRDALAPIVRAEKPLTREEQEYLSKTLDVASIEDALALLDVRTAVLVEDPISLEGACEAADKRPTLNERVRYLVKSTCRKRLRTGPDPGPPPRVDESTPGALVTSLLAQHTTGGPDAVRERAARLEHLRATVIGAEERARASAAAAEIFNSVGDERARDAARRAIHASPKAIDWRTSAWHRVAFASSGDVSLAAAISAWQPWEPIAQTVFAGVIGRIGDGAVQSISAERAYLLGQRGTYANQYCMVLVERGDVEAARGVAELAKDDVLRMQVLLAQGRYGAVLAKVPALLAALPDDDRGAATAFRLAYEGTRAALVLERPATFTEIVVKRWVLSEPHHVVDGVAPMVSLINACVLAPRSIGRPCIERIDALRREGRLAGVFGTLEIVIAGALRFVQDDYEGAAKEWRMLLRAAGWVQGPVRDPLAIAFDRAGEHDLAEEVDAPVVALADLPRTADPAWVRAARRAMKRGDKEKARKLAERIVEQWRYADEPVPAAAEMRELLEKLRR